MNKFESQPEVTVPTGYVPVVICTAHRGVFFGYIDEADHEKRTMKVYRCRNCLSWNSDNKGFMGLASCGPIGEARIGPAVLRITLQDVTAVMFCTEPAAAEWEKQGSVHS